MHYAHFFEQHLPLLASLGWPAVPVHITAPAKRTLTRLGFEVRAVSTLQSPGGTLAIVRLGAHQLPESHAVLSAFVETTWEVHGLLRWCAETLGADAALLIDPAVAWLHRLGENDHGMVCPDGETVEDRLLPLFAGGGDPVKTILGLQRESTESRGRGLRQWMQLWERRLGEACGMVRADARRLIEQLLLVRKCRGLARLHHSPGLARAVDRPLDLLLREETEPALTHSLRAIDLLEREAGLIVCRRGPAERQRTEEALARSELTAGTLLRSIELLSAGHLTAKVWVAAEAEPELQRLSWRLCVESPDPLGAQGAASPHVAQRLRLDVMDTGYEYILHVVERALRWIDAFNAGLRHEYAAAARQAFQPDFLTLAGGGADPAGFVTDPVHFALRHLLEIAAPLPPQNRLLKWLLTLRLLEIAEEIGLRPGPLPDLDRYC